MPKGVKPWNKIYTEERVEWLRNLFYSKYDIDNVKINYEEISKLFNIHFKVKTTVGGIKDCMFKHKIFKTTSHYNASTDKCMRRINCEPIGTEKKWGSTVYIKTKNDKLCNQKGKKRKGYWENYEIKSNYLYKQYNPEETIEKNECIIFLNGNENDYSKDNLYKISIACRGWLYGKYGKDFACSEKELTLAKINYFYLKDQLRKFEGKDKFNGWVDD